MLDTDATGKKADTADDYLYADNFDYKEEEVNYIVDRGNEPRYMLDTHGAWIVENGRLKQENAAGVTQWNGGDPATIVGDWRWMDYSASVDMELPNADANRYERLTIRAQTGMNWNNSGYTLEVNGAGSWKLFRIGSAVASGSVAKDDAGKYNVKLIGLGDSVYAYINGTLVASYTDANPMLSGRVKLSSNWSQVYADNLEIKTVKGGIPYATAMIDGQDDGVVYEVHGPSTTRAAAALTTGTARCQRPTPPVRRSPLRWTAAALHHGQQQRLRRDRCLCGRRAEG